MNDSNTARRAVRVRLVYDQDPASEPYTFDIMLDPAGRIVDSGPVFGQCADYPAILKPEGIIDFGPAMDEASRYYRTDLRTLPVTSGTQVVVRDADNNAWIYRVAAVEPR